MSLIGLLCYILLPILSYVGLDYALAFKGCVIPKESYKIARSFAIADFVLKLALYPLFSNPEDYVMTCVVCDVSLLMYNLIVIYWKLRKQNIRVIKKFPSNVNYTLLGIKSLLLFGGCLVIESFLIYNYCEWEDSTEALILVLCADLIGLLYLLFIVMQHIRLDRIKLPSMRSLQSLQSNRPPVLLLRSFELDKYPWWNNKTFDEELCGNLNINDCPIISLADPDQILPTGGSLKIQSKDDYWKSIIEELLKSCRAIVIVEGDSNGLSWEIDRIKSIYQSNPDKIFFYVPSNRYRILAWCINERGGSGIFRNFYAVLLKISSPIQLHKQLKCFWTNFSSIISSKGFNIEENYPGPNSIIAFEPSGRPRVISRKNGAELFNEVISKTIKYANNKYDYSNLAKKIESYEVNGFLSKSQMREYSTIVATLTKINNIIACILFAVGITIWFLI